MTGSEQREAARQFINRWRGKGKEDEDGRSYWIELLSNVFGVENVTERIDFEKKVVVDGNTKRIDVYIPETRVIIEQKSLNVPLNKKIRNSGDIDLTPFEQADRYNSTDNGNLILSKEEMEDLICKEPLSQKFIRPFMMGRDFINREYRYCLWLENANPSEIKKCPSVMERIENVREFRLKSKKAATRKKAEVPFLFDENHACKTDYIAIPVVSSQNRRYIPMELLHKDVIAGNKLFMMPEGSLYYFGILTSNVHMAWMRTVTGRLKSDYSYSNTIVYNNFPWPLSTNQQRLKIEQTAQSILDARSLYPDNSLADLYNPVLMPLELRKAHIANDKAVMAAYGFSLKMSEEDCVAELMKLYQKKLQEEKKMKSDKKSKTK